MAKAVRQLKSETTQRNTERFARSTHPRSISSCSGGSSPSCSRCSGSSRGGGGGRASIQVRDGVLTAFPMAFCLGFPAGKQTIRGRGVSEGGAVRANSQIPHESTLTRIQQAAGRETRPEVEDRPQRRFRAVTAFENNASEDLRPSVFLSHSKVMEVNRVGCVFQTFRLQRPRERQRVIRAGTSSKKRLMFIV